MLGTLLNGFVVCMQQRFIFVMAESSVSLPVRPASHVNTKAFSAPGMCKSEFQYFVFEADRLSIFTTR